MVKVIFARNDYILTPIPTGVGSSITDAEQVLEDQTGWVADLQFCGVSGDTHYYKVDDTLGLIKSGLPYKWDYWRNVEELEFIYPLISYNVNGWTIEDNKIYV